MTGSRRILVVDDDPHLRTALSELLQPEFTTLEAGSATDALAFAQTADIAAILLDIGLPDRDGRTLCRELRGAGIHCPIIMLTGATGEAETIAGLESGANDYVVKPFRFGELMARLRAQLRQHRIADDVALTVGPFRFLPTRRQLVAAEAGPTIRLTDKECAILRALHRARGRIVARETLLDGIWGYGQTVDTHTLETHVYRLRRKLDTVEGCGALVETTGGGYRLAN
jgi:DNA-binding response OmpR family regulator